MSTKDPTTNEQPHDSNEPPQPPPPSYAESGAFAPKTADSTSPAPAGQGSSGGVYQAQAYPPAPGQAYHPPPSGSAAPLGPPGGVYPPGPPGSVYPPGPPGGQSYGPPGSQPQGQPGAANFPQPPPGTSAVIYVVDDPAANSAAIPRRRGMPMAMLFFILGLCTWLGYLFGMCYMNHPDPRERWWARMCAIMCILWGTIIILASIFGTIY